MWMVLMIYASVISFLTHSLLHTGCPNNTRPPPCNHSARPSRPRAPRIDHLPSLFFRLPNESDRLPPVSAALIRPCKLSNPRRRHAICYHCTLPMHEDP